MSTNTIVFYTVNVGQMKLRQIQIEKNFKFMINSYRFYYLLND